MNLNLTLLGQMVTFIFFVWVTMKYVWPHITTALADRQAKIADGLAAAERGKHELVLAQQKSATILREAKQQANDIVEQANQHGAQLVDESKEKAKQEGARLLELAVAEIKQEKNNARFALRKEMAAVALMGAEKILQRHIDEAANSELVDRLIEEI